MDNPSGKHTKKLWKITMLHESFPMTGSSPAHLRQDFGDSPHPNPKLLQASGTGFGWDGCFLKFRWMELKSAWFFFSIHELLGFCDFLGNILDIKLVKFNTWGYVFHCRIRFQKLFSWGLLGINYICNTINVKFLFYRIRLVKKYYTIKLHIYI